MTPGTIAHLFLYTVPSKFYCSCGFKCVIGFLAKKMVPMRCETLHAICLVCVRAKERGSCFRG
jgi:hypothetical protein